MDPTQLKPESMFCLAYFSVLMKCGVPVLECLSLSKSFLVESDRWLFEEVEHGLLGGSPAPFHDAFSKIDTSEGKILTHKVRVGEEAGTLAESIYEALLIILLVRRLGAVPASVDVQQDVALLRRLMEDLGPEDRAAELGLPAWPQGAQSDDVVNSQLAKDYAALRTWLTAHRKRNSGDAGDRITRALTNDLRGNESVTDACTDKDIDALAERILLIVSNEHI